MVVVVVVVVVAVVVVVRSNGIESGIGSGGHNDTRTGSGSRRTWQW